MKLAVFAIFLFEVISKTGGSALAAREILKICWLIYSKYSTKHGVAVFRSARYQGRGAAQSATGAKNRPFTADAHALSPFSSKLINP
jgi:hypothetical protein